MKTFLLSFALLAGSCFGQILSDQEVKDLVANAKTAEDYNRLAKHFQAKAAALDGSSKCCEMMGDKSKMKEMKEKMKRAAPESVPEHKH